MTNTPSRTIQMLHVATVSAFAVAQPLFDLLGRNASFFAAHGAAELQIVAFVLLVLLVPPAFLIVLRVAIDLLSPRAGRAVHLAGIGVLGALASVPPVARAVGLTWPVAVAAALVVAFAVAAAYSHIPVVQRFLTVLTPVIAVFPVLFLFVSPASRLLGGAESTDAVRPEDAKDVPVVVVLFDEVSLANIVTPDGEIDEIRYPNFARLTSTSTWYREATTVALRTDQAVPAILTGRRTSRRDVPSQHAYPNNLFTAFSRSHDLHVREFVTQLCPAEACGGAADRPTGFGTLMQDATIVYAHLVTPTDAAETLLPPLGDRWGGFTRDQGGDAGGDPVRSWLRSAIDERETQHEGVLFERFLRGFREPEGKPQLAYAHVQVPHPAWHYLPDGTTYPTGDETPGYRNFRWGSDQYLVNEVLQRSLLQTKFADRLLGRFLDRMEEIDLFDDAMLVVVSDHGATWRANQTRREIDARNRASMLSVPLFVKYPKQEDARVDTDNAETIDVVPTIADVLDVDLGYGTDGESLRGRDRRREKRIFDGERVRDIKTNFIGVRRRAEEIEELFGKGRRRRTDLFGFGPLRDWIGPNMIGVSGRTRTAPGRVRFDAAPYRNVSLRSGSLPAFFRATVTGLHAGEDIAVTLNGQIAGVGQTFEEDGKVQIALMLSPHAFRNGRNTVQVNLVRNLGVMPIRS